MSSWCKFPGSLRREEVDKSASRRFLAASAIEGSKKSTIPEWDSKAVFEDCASLTTSGIILGLMFGGYTGLKQSTHLQKEFGEFQTLRSAPYKVPLNIVHAVNLATSWGWKLGFLAGTFGGTHRALTYLVPAKAHELQQSDNEVVRMAGEWLGTPMGIGVSSTAGPWTLMGTLYGAISKGGRGALYGGGIALGLSILGGVVQVKVDELSASLERQISQASAPSKQSDQERVGLMPSRVGMDEEPLSVREAEESRGDLLMMLQMLRGREKADGISLAGDKAEVKKLIRELTRAKP